MNYSNLVEHELKNKVFDDFFNQGKTSGIKWTQERDRIDFTLYNEKTNQVLLWAEAKRNLANPYTMITQLLLTLKKPYDRGEMPPAYLACFDCETINFVQFQAVQELFRTNNFNWTITPSNHQHPEFIKAEHRVKRKIEQHLITYNFDTDTKELKDFIKNTLILSQPAQGEVNDINVVAIYRKWVVEVKPHIHIGMDWTEAQKAGLIDADFFLADLLSESNKTITLAEKLHILLENNYYKLNSGISKFTKERIYENIHFDDDQVAHIQFWNKYRRPPRDQFIDKIIYRRDLLVPFDIRERKGAFYTPSIWVDKSQEYLATALGEDWQEHYYIWDCAAGTGNLLVGLTNPKNIFASTLDQADVDAMKQLNRTLFEDHIFQFDFLNPLAGSRWEGVPNKLRDILEDPEKRKKLVIYINPPYKEHGNKKHIFNENLSNLSGVAITTHINHSYINKIGGTAGRDLFVQFLARIKGELDGCIIGEFSKLKTLTGSNFKKFRQFFKAKLLSCFIVPSYSFDNVDGEFPIGFKIWDTKQEEVFTAIETDVFNDTGAYCCHKTFMANDNIKRLNKWIAQKQFKPRSNFSIGTLCQGRNDFQHLNDVYIKYKVTPTMLQQSISQDNLMVVAIYFAIQRALKSTWLNKSDQFYSPTDGWQNDYSFQTNCLAYTLFSNKGMDIRITDGANHWIPFTEQELGITTSSFDSHFMTDFMSARQTAISGTFQDMSYSGIPNRPIEWTEEAKAVLNVGKALYQYYHKNAKGKMGYTVNASLRDIKYHFKGVGTKGKMQHKSPDTQFNLLLERLSQALNNLAQAIEPKVYQYGFLS